MAKVGLVQRVPAVFTGVQDSRPEYPARVVDQDRHRAEVGDGPRERRVDHRAVADVGGDPQRTDLVGGGRAGFRVAFPDRDRRAECLETGRDAAAMPVPPPVTTATRPVNRILQDRAPWAEP